MNWDDLKDQLAGVDVRVTFDQGDDRYVFSSRDAWKDPARRLVREDHGLELVTWGEPRIESLPPGQGYHSHLHVRLAVRFNGTDGMRLDVCVESPWLNNFINERYMVRVEFVRGDNTQVLLDREGVTHGKWMRWRFVKWVGTSKPLDLSFDRAEWQREGKCPNYPLDLTISDFAIENLLAKFPTIVDPTTFPLGWVNPDMDDTGIRDDIGLLPKWWACALISQHPRLLRRCLQQDSLMSGYGIHVRDRETLKPISIEKHRDLVLVQPSCPDELRWRDFDAAHHPFWGGISYLLTGDLFDAEECAFLANWLVMSRNASYRQYENGLFVDHVQQRERAWDLRSVCFAAKWLPQEARPNSLYFERLALHNLQAIRATLDDKPHHGYFVNPPYANQKWFMAQDVNLSCDPWNGDYELAVLGWLRRQGWTVDAIVEGLSKLRVGLCAHAIAERAFPYRMAMKWGDVEFHPNPIGYLGALERTYANRNGRDWSWRGTRGYGAYARAALTTAVACGVPGAAEAIAKCENALGAVSWSHDPTWSQEP